MNSPETPIYHKSSTLYAFAFSRQAIREQQQALLVEGYMDALAAYQSGHQNVVASSGTALTEQQLRHLQPYAKTLLFAFDMDRAGQDAARRAYDLTLDFDFQVKMVQLPHGKDIAEFALEHTSELAQILNESRPYGEIFYQQLQKTYGLGDIFAKRKIMQEFYPFFSLLKSSVEKDFYVRKMAQDFELTETQIYDEFKGNKLPKYHPARLHRSLVEKPELQPKKYLGDELLLGFMIEFPRISLLHREQLQEHLFGPDLKPIYNAYFAHYNSQGLETPTSDMPVFLASLEVSDQQLAQRAALLSFYVAEYYGEMSEAAIEAEIRVLIKNLQQLYLRKQRQTLQLQLLEAEKNNDKILREQYLQQLRSLPL